MTAFLSPVAGAAAQFFTNQGVVLAGGKLTTYIAGSTTLQATWTDSGQSVQNANPIILDSAGRPSSEVWLANGVAYKFVLSDSSNNVLGTYDNVSGINVSTAVFSEWVISGLVVTYVSATSFTVPGDQTALLQANRRVQYTLNSGTYYGYISTAVYNGSTLTTVTIVPDVTNLDATLSTVNYSFMNALNVSVPQQYIIAAADKVPSRTGNTDKILTNTDGITSVWSALLKAGVIRFADSTDTTKRIAFNAASITTGTTRTITMPDRDITLGGAITLSSRTANTILGSTDSGNIVDITANSFTQTFTAAATLGNGWYVWWRNSGSGDVTLDPNASELIDGLTSYVSYPGEIRLIQCNGTAFTTFVLCGFVRTCASTFSFVPPPGYARFGYDLQGAGGGGGGGEGRAAGNIRIGGTAGGGGARVQGSILASLVANPTTLTIGAAGTSGAGGVGGVGSVGGIGGNTSIGALAIAYGGGGGAGGDNTANNGSGSGGGTGAAGLSGGGNNQKQGGLPSTAYAGGTNEFNTMGGGGAGGPAGVAGLGSCAEWGGASGASNSGIGNNCGTGGGSSIFGGSAGGNGGSMVAANTGINGTAGGLTGTYTVAGGGAGGTGTAGAVGTAGTAGKGGGGGAPNTAGTGGVGGVGGSGGNGGGGGGAGTSTGGAGGLGSIGSAVIWGIA